MKIFYLLILALLVGCAKQFQKDDNALIITAISTDFDTKASETAFEAGDKIGIFLESSHGNNSLYETADGSTWRGYDNIYKVNAGEKATAYYPYSESATNLSAIEISGNVDFMITNATPITTSDNRASVALNFRHILSKLVVNIEKLEEINGVKIVSQDSVVVKNVFRKAVVNITDGKISGLTDKGDLRSAGNSAIVIPQTAQKIKLVFKMANGTFDSLAYNSPIIFESGKKTTLTAVSNADLYFTSFLNLSSGEAQTDLPLSFYVAPGRTWTLTSSAPWLTFSATTGIGAATVKVNVQANVTYPLKPRTATITLKDDKPSFASPQIVMQNYVRIPTVEIAGTNWTMANLTGSYQGQTSGFTVCANPQDYGTFWKWGSKYMYARESNGNPSGHWGAVTTWAATAPTAQSKGYDYGSSSLASKWGAPVGDPCQSLGAAYKTPTSAQMKALYDTGRSGYTSYKSIKGFFFGPSASSCSDQNLISGCIFLPSAGYRDWSNGSLFSEAVYGYYWSSSVYDANYGWGLHFNYNGGINPEIANSRGYGFSVRCVAD